MVRTRFAPSPTGYMHVGGVRTALFAWLVAKQGKGKFILRIEDTDRSRHVDQSEKHIIASLKWLGIESDEPIVRQSERLSIYRQWGEKLIASGRAYADPYSPEQLDDLRKQAEADKKPFLFRDHRPKNPPDWDGSQPLRFLSEPKAVNWNDEVMGDLSTGPEAIDDFILIKSDGYPTYNFAHIVDDNLMAISHVIRSQEFLPSVPKFLNLYEALKVERPKLATLPYVMAPGGKKKLSKRDGAKDILDYKQEGYLPEALINFLATLGWNDGSEKEIFSLRELEDKFSLGKVQRSGAQFDEQRLTWMNGVYIRDKPLDHLYIDSLGTNDMKTPAFWPKSAFESAYTEGYRKKVLALVKGRLKFLAELPELTTFFFEEPDLKSVSTLYLDPADKQLKDLSPHLHANKLRAVIEELEKSDFSEADIKERLNGLLETLDTKPGILFSVVRIAVTGSQISPEIFGTLEVLGREESLKRLGTALATLSQQS